MGFVYRCQLIIPLAYGLLSIVLSRRPLFVNFQGRVSQRLQPPRLPLLCQRPVKRDGMSTRETVTW